MSELAIYYIYTYNFLCLQSADSLYNSIYYNHLYLSVARYIIRLFRKGPISPIILKTVVMEIKQYHNNLTYKLLKLQLT